MRRNFHVCQKGAARLASLMIWLGRNWKPAKSCEQNPLILVLAPSYGHDERLWLNALYPSIGQSSPSVSCHLSKLSHIVRRVRPQ